MHNLFTVHHLKGVFSLAPLTALHDEYNMAATPSINAGTREEGGRRERRESPRRSAARRGLDASPPCSPVYALWAVSLLWSQFVGVFIAHMKTRFRRKWSLAFEVLSPALVLLVLLYGIKISPSFVISAYNYTGPEPVVYSSQTTTTTLATTTEEPVANTTSAPWWAPTTTTASPAAQVLYLLELAGLYHPGTRQSYFDTVVLPELLSTGSPAASQIFFQMLANGAAVRPFPIPTIDLYALLVEGLKQQVYQSGNAQLEHASAQVWQFLHFGRLAFVPDTPAVRRLVSYLTVVSGTFSRVAILEPYPTVADALAGTRTSSSSSPPTTNASTTTNIVPPTSTTNGTASSATAAVPPPRPADATTEPMWAVVEFSALDVEAGDVDFTIHMNVTYLPDNNVIVQPFPQGLGADFSKYIYSGFTSLQYEIGEYVRRATSASARQRNVSTGSPTPDDAPGGLVDSVSTLMLSVCGQAMTNGSNSLFPKATGFQPAVINFLLANSPGLGAPLVTNMPLPALAIDFPCQLEVQVNCSTTADDAARVACLQRLRPSMSSDASCARILDGIGISNNAADLGACGPLLTSCGVSNATSYLFAENAASAAALGGPSSAVMSPPSMMLPFSACLRSQLIPTNVSQNGQACLATPFGDFLRASVLIDQPCLLDALQLCPTIVNTSDGGQVEACIQNAQRVNFNSVSRLCSYSLLALTRCQANLNSDCTGPVPSIVSFPWRCLHMNYEKLTQSCLSSSAVANVESLTAMNATVTPRSPTTMLCRLGYQLDMFFQRGIAGGAFPTKACQRQPFLSSSGSLFGLIVAVAFIFPFTATVRFVVSQHERGHHKLLYSMGVPRAVSLSVVFFTQVLFLFVSSFLAVLVVNSMLPQFYTGMMFGLLFAYATSVASLGCLVALPFSRTRMAASAAPMLFILATIPALVTLGKGTTGLVLSGILSPSTLVLAFGYAAQAAQSTTSFNIASAAGAVGVMSIIYFLLALCFVVLGESFWVKRAVELLLTPCRMLGRLCTCCDDAATGSPDTVNMANFRPLVESQSGSSLGSPPTTPVNHVPNVAPAATGVPGVVIRNVRLLAHQPGASPLALTLPGGLVHIVTGAGASGKSTLMDLCAGGAAAAQLPLHVCGCTRRDDDASVEVLNLHDPRAVPGWCRGVCFQEDIVWDALTVKEHLDLMLRIKGLRPADCTWRDDIAAQFGLAEKLNDAANKLSLGTQRRLCVAMSVVSGSQLLLLDEPFAGIDAAGRRQLWSFLHDGKRRRCTVLGVTSHSAEEEIEMADNVVLLDSNGGCLRQGPPSQLLAASCVKGYRIDCHFEDALTTAQSGTVLRHVHEQVTRDATLVRVTGVQLSLVVPTAQLAARLLEWLDTQRHTLGVDAVAIGTPTFDDEGKSPPTIPSASAGKPTHEEEMSERGAPTKNADGTKTSEMDRPAALSAAAAEGSRVGSDAERSSRSSGWRLHRRLVLCILSRRFASAYSAPGRAVLQFLLPLLCFVLAVRLMNLEPPPPTPLKLTADALFGVVTGIDGEVTSSLTMPVGGSNVSDASWTPLPPRASLPAFSQVLWRSTPTPLSIVATTTVPPVAANATQPQPPPMVVNSVDMSNYLQDTIETHAGTSRYGALVFTDPMMQLIQLGGDPFTGASLEYDWLVDTVLHNTSSNHALPAYLTELLAARVRASSGLLNASFVARSSPFHANVPRFTVETAVKNFVSVALLLIPFTFLPAKYVAHAVHERETGFLDMQLASHLTMFHYYLGTFLWNMICYFLFSLAALLVFVLFGSSTVWTDDLDAKGMTSVAASAANSADLFHVLGLLLMYGLCATTYGYVLGRWFKSHGTAQNALTLFGLLTGFALVVATTSVEFISDTDPATTRAKATNAKVSGVLRYFFPAFSLGEAFMKISLLPIYRLLNQQQSMNTWTAVEPALGPLSLFVVYGAIVLSWDYILRLRLLRFCAPRSSRGSNHADADDAAASAATAAPSSVSVSNALDAPLTTAAGQQMLDEKSAAWPFLSVKSAVVTYPVPKPNCTLTTRHPFPSEGRHVTVLDDVTFTLNGAGERLVLLGPNGSGKSTLLKAVAGVARLTEGQIRLRPSQQGPAWCVWHDRSIVGRSIGYSAEAGGLDEGLTPYGTLHFLADARGLRASRDTELHVNEVLKMCGLEHRQFTVARHLSEGAKRRLAVAVALVGFPDLVILDEPSRNLDTTTRHAMLNALASHPYGRRCSVLMSSQHADEALWFGNRAALLVGGRLQASGTTTELRRDGAPHLVLDIRLLNHTVAAVDARGSPKAATTDDDDERKEPLASPVLSGGVGSNTVNRHYPDDVVSQYLIDHFLGLRCIEERGDRRRFAVPLKATDNVFEAMRASIVLLATLQEEVLPAEWRPFFAFMMRPPDWEDAFLTQLASRGASVAFSASDSFSRSDLRSPIPMRSVKESVDDFVNHHSH